jgi:ribose transport system permease protein
VRRKGSQPILRGALRWAPLILLALLVVGFGAVSRPFLTIQNLGAILAQSSWLIVVGLGMNFVLLTAGVDLSVGAAMYLAAIVVGLGLTTMPVWVCLLGAVLVGAAFGMINGLLVVRFHLPAFVVTLSTLFMGRGLGLYLSSTKLVPAGVAVAELGRARAAAIPVPVWLAITGIGVGWIMLRATPLGPYIRCVGSDREAARRAGVPVLAVIWGAYTLCGAFAGLGGFISLSQTSAASAAFAQNAEFLAIAAAVLGGTSLFGGRGSLWAPVVGAVLITTVQNGLVMVNANPYAYPVVTGSVIFVAALVDSLRLRTMARLERYRLVSDID